MNNKLIRVLILFSLFALVSTVNSEQLYINGDHIPIKLTDVKINHVDGSVRIKTDSNFNFEDFSNTSTPFSTENSLSKINLDDRIVFQQTDVTSLIVEKKDINPENRSFVAFDNNDKAKIPFAVKNSVILQLKPNLSPIQIDKLAQKYSMEVVKAFPEINAIHVRVDLSRFMSPLIEDKNVNDRFFRGLVEVINFFKSDPLIVNAAPDLVVKSQTKSYIKPLKPSGITSSIEETTDWGVLDIQANNLWGKEGARDGALLGVLDAGFGRHEDLTFARSPLTLMRADHGNHVSGIACAKHNKKGVKGVLPNCFVVPKADEFFSYESNTNDVMNFYRMFSQVLSEMNDIIAIRDGIKVYNISLGYNWESNFGLNHDDESSYIRALVESQGEFVISILVRAEILGKTIYSAAGNDSLQNDVRSAKYASPFNWAAFTARERGVSFAGVVIEAHDKNGERASFSNAPGMLSCPGEKVLSVLAHDNNRIESNSSYGYMSGTSMASPYCAGAHQLFALVNPKLNSKQIVDCFIESGYRSGNQQTPRVKLSDAMASCSQQ